MTLIIEKPKNRRSLVVEPKWMFNRYRGASDVPSKVMFVPFVMTPALT